MLEAARLVVDAVVVLTGATVGVCWMGDDDVVVGAGFGVVVTAGML